MDPLVFEKLLDISRKMAENRFLDPLLEYAISVAIELVGAERGYLVLVGEDGSLDFRVRLDHNGRKLDKPEEQISHTVLSDVIRMKEPVLLADALGHHDYQDKESVASLKLRSVMCVPLITGGDVLGAIYVENRSARAVFQEVNLRPLTFFASQAAVSIQNAILNDHLEAQVRRRTEELARTNERLMKEIEERSLIQAQLREMAITDPLTQILNRRHFFELAEEAFANCKAAGFSLAAILMDIDHFKQINDSFGHLAGDQALTEFVARVKKHLQVTDIFARYGGEEFVILMPDVGLDAAKKIAEQLRVSVNHKPLSSTNGDSITITASIGLAVLAGEVDLTLDKLLERADDALYQSKQNGRDKVTVWQD